MSTSVIRASARIVIVNWRQSELTIRACQSIQPQLRAGDQLVVVDNASGDASVQQIQAAGFNVVQAAANRGFAAGVNLGASGMTQDFLVLLNNDAVAEAGFLDALLQPFTGSDKTRLGATTAHLVLAGRWRPAAANEPALTGLDKQRWTRCTCPEEEAESERLMNSTGNLVDKSANGYDRDWLVPETAVSSGPEVFGICGGACAIRAQAWHELDGMREDLFMYYEDTDFSWRLHEHGWQVEYVKDAVAVHEHAASAGSNSEMFIRVNTRNRLLIALAHADWATVARAFAHTAARAILGPNRLLTMLSLKEALGRLPRELRRRRSRTRAGDYH